MCTSSWGIRAMSRAMSSASILSTTSSRRGFKGLNLVKSWWTRSSCIFFSSGKSPGDIWCSRCSWSYICPKFLIRSFFLLSLPNTDGMSFLKALIMYAWTCKRNIHCGEEPRSLTQTIQSGHLNNEWVSVKIQVFWALIPHQLVNISWCFQESPSLNLQGEASSKCQYKFSTWHKVRFQKAWIFHNSAGECDICHCYFQQQIYINMWKKPGFNKPTYLFHDKRNIKSNQQVKKSLNLSLLISPGLLPTCLFHDKRNIKSNQQVKKSLNLSLLISPGLLPTCLFHDKRNIKSNQQVNKSLNLSLLISPGLLYLPPKLQSVNLRYLDFFLQPPQAQVQWSFLGHLLSLRQSKNLSHFQNPNVQYHIHSSHTLKMLTSKSSNQTHPPTQWHWH